MVDVLTPEQRKLNMSRIRNRDTKPEMRVRRTLHAMGFRYRLHSNDLPGRPDIVFRKKRKAIFVHGCFFHSHACPAGRVIPKTNEEFWQKKRSKTVLRDTHNAATLLNDGWRVLVVWECSTKGQNDLATCLQSFLID